jgi:DNA-binding SARP family transcriptional activator
MPGQVPASERFIRRLADGVPRARLIDPVLAARPPFLVVSAPSGYGKTAFAAQLVCSGAFDSFIWVDGLGSRGSLERALLALLEQLTACDVERVGWSTEDLVQSCLRELRSLPSEAPHIIVLDAMDGESIGEELASVAALAMETPPGSTVVLLTNSLPAESPLPKETWLVDSAMLRLDEVETMQLWALHHGGPPKPGQASLLAEMSGRHAALASLMARRAALLGGVAGPGSPDSLSTELIRSLVFSQLTPAQVAVLRVAAVAGEGTDALVRACIDEPDVQGALARIAAVLPLISFTKADGQGRFSVSGLVDVALGGAAALAEVEPLTVQRLVRHLSSDGRAAESLNTACRSQMCSLVAETLRAVGETLVCGPEADLVSDAIASLSPAVLSCDAHLLTLHAEAEWHRGHPSCALRSARMGLGLAENAGDEKASRKAHLAIARFRWSMGDFDGIAAELTPLVTGWNAVDDVDDLCSLVVSAQITYALAADREGLASCQAIAKELRASSAVRESARARMDEVDGVIASFLDGDNLVCLHKCRAAAAFPGLSAPRRVVALNNAATSALVAGVLSEADSLAELALSLAHSGSVSSATMLSLLSVRALAVAVQGDTSGARAALNAAIDAESADGDKFGLTSALTFASIGALITADRPIALDYAERAVAAASETRSPILVWHADLTRAMCCLAVDDMERARSTASHVLPLAEHVAAKGLVLHARMILAELALRDDALAAAVQHLSEVSEYIVDASPALIVACYLRTFPTLLGPLALAMGVDAIPIRVLNLLNGEYERGALEAAAAVLTKPELNRLKRRMRQEADRTAARDRAGREEAAVCDVRLFGGLQVTAPHGIVADRDWGKRKARQLFAMLVARGDTDVPRGEILDHLWPEMDEERALSNFYVVWSAMKRALTPGGTRDQSSPFVEHARGVCRVVAGRVVSDLDRFKAAQARARVARSAGDQAAELVALLEALELYRGEVLPGDVYDDWFGPIRERFKREYEDTALRVGRLHADAGEPLEALSVLRDASARNPWREDLYQAILRLQIAAGQRAAAIETYFLCRSRLVEDLGIDPSRETTALYEEVLGMDERSV